MTHVVTATTITRSVTRAQSALPKEHLLRFLEMMKEMLEVDCEFVESMLRSISLDTSRPQRGLE
jgi:hypothetical protein